MLKMQKKKENSDAVFHCFTYYFKIMTQKLNYTEMNMTKLDEFMALYLTFRQSVCQMSL
jgi:hypothetical protein